MATSVLPALIDALVAHAKANLTGTNVYDGVGVTDEPGGYLMVGVDNPDGDYAVNAAASAQEWANLGALSRDENGSVFCVAESWNGDGDAKAARDAAFAICAGLENLLRANPNLDVPGVLWTGYGSSTQLLQNQDDNGAVARVSFAISFRARI